MHNHEYSLHTSLHLSVICQSETMSQSTLDLFRQELESYLKLPVRTIQGLKQEHAQVTFYIFLLYCAITFMIKLMTWVCWGGIRDRIYMHTLPR